MKKLSTLKWSSGILIKSGFMLAESSCTVCRITRLCAWTCSPQPQVPTSLHVDTAPPNKNKSEEYLRSF